MKLSVPAKTYLVGEYSVLLGGAAIGLATQPCFEIEYVENHNPQTQSCIFHPESPAGRYLKKYDKTVTVNLKDPYPFGGFGRSTTEYWAVITPDFIKNDMTTSNRLPSDFSQILKEYKNLHQGSGVDLAFQYFGKICLADPLIHFYQTFNWHFENLDFYILSTGYKISTHEHLKNLDLALLKDLPALSNRITQVFAENKEFEFLSLMKQWCELLKQHNLIHPKSQALKIQLEQFESIKLAKPSGALGADVIIVFFAKSQKESVKNYLNQNNFILQAHTSDLVHGVAAQLELIKSAVKGVYDVG